MINLKINIKDPEGNKKNQLSKKNYKVVKRNNVLEVIKKDNYFIVEDDMIDKKVRIKNYKSLEEVIIDDNNLNVFILDNVFFRKDKVKIKND